MEQSVWFILSDGPRTVTEGEPYIYSSCCAVMHARQVLLGLYVASLPKIEKGSGQKLASSSGPIPAFQPAFLRETLKSWGTRLVKSLYRARRKGMYGISGKFSPIKFRMKKFSYRRPLTVVTCILYIHRRLEVWLDHVVAQRAARAACTGMSIISA